MALRYDPKRASQLPRPYQMELSSALVAAVTPITPGDKLLVEVATGGGKRRILNDFLTAYALGLDVRTLVVAKDWTLTFRLAGTPSRRRA